MGMNDIQDPIHHHWTNNNNPSVISFFLSRCLDHKHRLWRPHNSNLLVCLFGMKRRRVKSSNIKRYTISLVTLHQNKKFPNQSFNTLKIGNFRKYIFRHWSSILIYLVQWTRKIFWAIFLGTSMARIPQCKFVGLNISLGWHIPRTLEPLDF